ncbi:hypothetical protein ACQHIV_33180 [Kribbella sp. GL6]|uniref:hypothetical protein n=1 Tax=Kribbella sp. GL6 TaxID=3419765 RepID=UPI003D05ABF9
MQRVVALVSRVEGTFEFEVQPLREYFAARHLYNSSPYSPPGNPRPGTKPEIFEAISPNSYWLNVTRFYAGCYSVGELPGLASQLKALILDSREGMTSFPRVLATSLLADRVFHQEPRVTTELALSSVDELSVRAVASSRMFDESGPRLNLPPDCGQAEVSARLRALLETAPTREFAFEVAVSLRDPGRADNRHWWLEVAKSKTADEMPAWVEIGRRLDILDSLTHEEAASVAIVGGNAVSRLMVAAGCTVLAESAIEEEEVTSSLLSGEIPVERASGALFAPLRSVLHPSQLEMFVLHRGASTLGNEATVSDDYRSTEVRKLIADLIATYSKNEVSWTRSLTPWIEICDSLRRFAGMDSWLGYVAASIAAGIRSQHERGRRASRLFDDRHGLVQRARNARMRPNATHWWTQQLEVGSTSLDRKAWLLYILTLGSPKLLLELADLISFVVDGMEPRDINNVAHALKARELRMRSTTGSGAPRYDLFERRFGTVPLGLVAMRFGGGFAQAFAGRVESRSIAALPSMVDAVADWAIDSALGSQITAHMLSRFRSLALLGNGESNRWWLSDRKIPDSWTRELSDMVLADPAKYPGRLVSMSDARLSLALLKERQPVAIVARRASWSAD